MTTIQLPDSVAKALELAAHAQGMTLEGYLRSLAASQPKPERKHVKIDEFMQKLDALSGPGNPDYQGTYPREDIYNDHA